MTGHDAIAALVYVYAERIDAGDFEDVARLFTHGRYGMAGGPAARGAAAVSAALAIVQLHDGSPRTKHVTTNLTVDIDESNGTATARSYFTVLQATDALPSRSFSRVAITIVSRTQTVRGTSRND